MLLRWFHASSARFGSQIFQFMWNLLLWICCTAFLASRHALVKASLKTVLELAVQTECGITVWFHCIPTGFIIEVVGLCSRLK